MTRAKDDHVAIYISEPQLALLKKLDFPCSERIVASATPTEEGIELSGTRRDFESLAGWVAGEANHARPGSRADLLNDLSEQIECVAGF